MTKRYGGYTDRVKGYADLETRYSSYNTKAEGLVGDSVIDDYANLNTLANVTMQPNGGTLDVVGVLRVGTNLAFPSNVRLNFVEGAYLAPDGGVTVTINGKMTFTHAKIFGGGGTIAFGATARTGPVRPEWWGALGDGATDDATPVFAAFTAAKAQGRKVQFGAKNYRVTTGFTNNTNYHDMVMEGKSSSRETNNSQGTQITLDSNNAATFFYSHSSRHHLQVRNITFKCTQYALDRAFFQFTGTNWHTFENVNFEAVERPIVYKAGSYFQNASFTNVAFSNSGTIHSETTALVGTLLRLNNVNHEGTTPINTAKVMMNLQGIRMIVGENVLLEGTVPAAGWGIVNFDLAAAGPGISTQPTVKINGFWIEIPGTPPLYTGRFSGVTAEITLAQGLLNCDGTPTAILDKGSILIVGGACITGAPGNLNNLATFSDVYSQLILSGSKLRSLSNLTGAISNKQIHFSRCISAQDDAAGSINTPVSTVDNEMLFDWKGELLRNQFIVSHPAAASFAHLRTIITDATYGRLININKNGQGFAQWTLTVTCPPEWANMVLRVQLYAKFRTRVGGIQQLQCSGAVAPTLVAQVTEEAFDWYNLAVRVPAGGGVINFLNNVTGGGTVANDIQIAAMRVTLGEAFGRFPSLEKPLCVQSEGTAVPATGTWAVGDRVRNVAPAVGQPKAWVCTVAGTPGTWVSEGNL